MESLYLLIPLSLVIVAIAVWIFIRASETGQFDDLEGPAHSILMDDDRPRSAIDADLPRRTSTRQSATTD
ncbi:MAG TPA: cbb3-type cytochrome oxidase assembly protein CcoS [Burkholderiaceae bacterium]|jgi:cbb3-type cytochrome oxidase maturation protein|nr:cbb3-type cytochrome oxidase assembly protein CcoS [Burkholderiaceae bacterium]